MGIFDKFKNKNKLSGQEEVKSQAPEEKENAIQTNTMVTVYFDRTGISTKEFQDAIALKFGAESIAEVDESSPSMTNIVIHLDGLDYMFSYMPFPFPEDELYIPELFKFNGYITDEEREDLVNHKSFCLITQIGAGKNLEGKRRACLGITLICGAVLAVDSAAGVCCSASGLLFGKSIYLHHADIAERERDNPEYFPSLLWVLVYSTEEENGAHVIETCGLKEFGFMELQFYKPEEEWHQSYEKLYIMAVLQITGKEYYKNMDTIAFTKDKVAIFKKSGDKLAVIGV